MLWFQNDFLEPYPDPTFQLASDPYRILPEFFLKVFKHFTFVLPSCKCVRLHILTRFFKGFKKRNLCFWFEDFCWEIFKFYKFFRVFLLQIHFGSGASRIRNEFLWIHIRILLKVSDPTRCGSVSGSNTLVVLHKFAHRGRCHKINYK